ncbi:MAG: hypothetical protein F4X81_15210 [Gammaproteobacteria bacterium]|nr:hypothetical protein [Gammaproteobacteria bacterium]MYH13764.1 hypothetical protein [Gammaproteobacteria bacterium]MYK83916.1 hypothetical protein [Gammaproteobacteria bacterium]
MLARIIGSLAMQIGFTMVFHDSGVIRDRHNDRLSRHTANVEGISSTTLLSAAYAMEAALQIWDRSAKVNSDSTKDFGSGALLEIDRVIGAF